MMAPMMGDASSFGVILFTSRLESLLASDMACHAAKASTSIASLPMCPKLGIAASTFPHESPTPALNLPEFPNGFSSKFTL